MLNIALTLLVLGGLGVLTWQSYAGDAKNEKYQAALKEGRQQAERVKELAESPQKIPVERRIDLAAHGRQDPRPATVQSALRQLPRLQRRGRGRHHPPREADGRRSLRLRQPRVADRVPDVKGISSPKFFGNTKFKQKKMYGFIKETFSRFRGQGAAADHPGPFRTRRA